MKKRKLISQEAANPGLTTLAKESDRGCVILASAVLEHHLTTIHEAFITAHLTGIQHPKDFFESLTTRYGPLSDFSGKIKLAFAYGLITIDEFKGLESVRKLRNEAAHEIITFSFEDKGIKKLVAQLVAFDRSNQAALIASKDRFPELPECKRTFIRSIYGLRLTLGDKYVNGLEAILKKREPYVTNTL